MIHCIKEQQAAHLRVGLAEAPEQALAQAALRGGCALHERRQLVVVAHLCACIHAPQKLVLLPTRSTKTPFLASNLVAQFGKSSAYTALGTLQKKTHPFPHLHVSARWYCPLSCL